MHWCNHLLPGSFVFHAGAVSLRGEGIALFGPSGAGKTTLSLALAQRGFHYLTDDFATINGLELQPFPRAVNIRNGTLQMLGLRNNLNIPSTGTKLYRQFVELSAKNRLTNTPNYVKEADCNGIRVDVKTMLPEVVLGEPCPLKHLIFLDGFSSNTTLIPIKATMALPLLLKHCRNLKGQQRIQKMISILKNVSCYRMTFGPDVEQACQAIHSLVT